MHQGRAPLCATSPRFLTRGLGLAAAQGDLWFVTVFGAASVVTIIEVVRRLLCDYDKALKTIRRYAVEAVN